MLVQQVLQALEVAGVGHDDAAVHHRGLDDHAGDLALVLGERALHLGEVVERHHANQVGERLRDAERLRQGDRVLARPDLVRVGGDREHQRVVVAVVATLDLDEHVPAGRRAHEAPGFQRRLGAGVAEPPQRQAEPVHEALADRVEILRRLREMRAARGRLLERLDDLRVRVADDHRAVAEVEVDVLVAVDVPQAIALPVIDEHGVRRRVLPARRDAARDRALCDLAVLDRSAVLRLELRFFVGDQLVDELQVEIGGLPDSHGSAPPSVER